MELKRLDRTGEKTSREIGDLDEKLQNKLNELHNDIITLKVKSSLWGAGAGMIVSAFISALISFVFQAKH